MDNELIFISSCFVKWADFWERTEVSWHSWQMLCTFTIAMIIFSVVMHGSYCQIPLPNTFGYTTSFLKILSTIFKVMSAMWKASDMLAQRFQATAQRMFGRDPEPETLGAEPCCSSVLSTGLFLLRHDIWIKIDFSQLAHLSPSDCSEHKSQYRTCTWICAGWPMLEEFQYPPCNYGSLQSPCELT